jgi:hypothetical protein
VSLLLVFTVALMLIGVGAGVPSEAFQADTSLFMGRHTFSAVALLKRVRRTRTAPRTLGK